jgi:hypothetical protein
LSDEEKSDLESSGGSEFNSDEDFDQGIGLESDAEDELLGERVEQELLEIGMFCHTKVGAIKLID